VLSYLSWLLLSIPAFSRGEVKVTLGRGCAESKELGSQAGDEVRSIPFGSTGQRVAGDLLYSYRGEDPRDMGQREGGKKSSTTSWKFGSLNFLE